MPDVIITPSSGIIEFKPSSTTVNKIEASGNTFNLINTANPSGTIFNIEATNGSLFSVVDDLDGTLMSVNNNAGLPVLEVFSDDKIVGGRFGQNDFVVSSSGNVGIGQVPASTLKLAVNGNTKIKGSLSFDSTGASDLISINPNTSVITMMDTNADNMIDINTTYMHFFLAGQSPGLYLDRSSARVGILKTNPATALDVNGTVTANSFVKTLGAGQSSTDLLQAGGGVVPPASLSVSYAGTAGSANQVANTLTRGSYLTGNNFNGSAATTWAVDATTTATVSKVVARDANGHDYRVYGFAQYFNMSHAAATRNTDTVFYSSTDDYIRKNNAVGMRTSLNVPTRTGDDASGTWSINVTGNAGTVTNGVYTTGNQSIGGVKTFTSQIINTTANSTTTGGGQIYLNGDTGNRIDFNTNGWAAPTFTTRSVGTKIVLYPNVGASSADYALGIESSTLWQSVPTTSQQFKWYGGTTNIATLTGAGQLTLTSNAGTVTPILTLLNTGTTNGSFRFCPQQDAAGGYITFNSSANTTTNGTLIGGTSTMTGLHGSRRQGAFQWFAGTTDESSRFEFLTANGGTTAQTMTSRMAITAQGRVGIGTITPSATLNVVGDAIVDNLKLDGNTLSANNTNGSLIIAPNGTGALIASSTTANARGTNAVDLQNSRSAVTQVASGANSVIGGGSNNTSSNVSSTVGGGAYNTSSAYSSTVGGGSGNTSSAYSSTVGGGRNNTSSHYYSTVGGGTNNTSSGFSSTVGGGSSNTSSHYYSTVGGGTINTSSGVSSTVGGGSSNTSSGVSSTVGGGTNNTSSGFGSTVPGGFQAKATKHGELSHAAGQFGNKGDAQHTILIARNVTTNATATILTLDGAVASATNRLVIPAETTWVFDIKLSAYNDTNNLGSGWNIRGCIRRNAANGTAILGTNSTTTWTDGGVMNSLVVSATADDTNEALQINVTGLASTNIRWVAVVDISQVSYGTP